MRYLKSKYMYPHYLIGVKSGIKTQVLTQIKLSGDLFQSHIRTAMVHCEIEDCEMDGVIVKEFKKLFPMLRKRWCKVADMEK